jgi:hypothetical protein
MVGRAKSQSRRNIEDAKLKDELLMEAVNRYRNQGSHLADGARPKRKSMKTIALEVSREHPTASWRHLVPSQSTISRRLQGKPSLQFSREQRAHLTKAECDIVIAYVIELSNRCIPPSHRRLKEHIDEIIRAWDSFFPGVGKNYTQRFVDRHSDQLSTYWSRGLDGQRTNAVNPTTNKLYFKLLGNTITWRNIEDENTYGMDETGIQGGSGESERVIGQVGKSIQGQKRGGGRENNTVMVTICGNGTALPPTVVFKGKHYLVRWKQDNPLNAS